MIRLAKAGPDGALPADELKALAAAAAAGDLVVFPTDTVYGVGTSALAPGAFERVSRPGPRPSAPARFGRVARVA